MAALEPEQEEHGDGATRRDTDQQAHLMPVKGSHDPVPGNAKDNN